MAEMAMERRRIPVGRGILLVLVAVGLVAAVIRFTQGLGAATNLTDSYPWGMWIGFDVVTGVALSAGAFTLAAMVYIFRMEKYRPVLRPALLTGFLGYVLAVLGLLADLGRPYRVWYVMLPRNWNLHSVLFEVGWCVILYTTVLALELLPLVFERFRKPDALPAQLIRTWLIPLVIVGITLSTMHQSSLGGLFLILRDQLHPLWQSPILPVFFYVSAIAAGLAMVIIESSLSARAFRRGLEMDVLSGLGRMIPYLLGLYFVLKVGDLVLAGDFGLLFEGSLRSNLFLVEMVVGVVLPIVLFALPRVRRSPAGLFWSAVVVVVGLVLNRIDVSLVGPQPPAGATYFPHWMEFAITIGLVAGGVFVFALAARFLPIFPEMEAEAH